MNLINYFAVFALALFLLACSNNPLNPKDKTDDTKNIVYSGEYDFREAKWGMSKDEVMQTEDGEPVFNSENKIDYIVAMYGLDGKIGYTFKNDELVRASFYLLTEPKDSNGYIDIYTKIQKELKKKYGKTVIDTVQLKDPSAKIDPDKNGDAVCNGELLYATQWDLPSSDVQLLLRGENSECFITIMYLSEEGFRQMLKERNN